MDDIEREKRRAYHREWEAKNPDKVQAYRKLKYERHRDAILKRGKVWRDANKDKERERTARRFQERQTPERILRKRIGELWRKSPRERRRYGRHSKYLTFEKYESLWPQLDAGGPCDCCGVMGKMHIDHDHKTMKFRGVVCDNCNKGFGHFSDSVERLQMAIKYLERTTWVSGR